MISRMRLNDIQFVTTTDDLFNRIVIYYSSCLFCDAYKRVSRNPKVLECAMLEHLKEEHQKDAESPEVSLYKQSIKITPVSIPIDDYYRLHDIVIIDP